MRYVKLDSLEPHPLALMCASWSAGEEREAAEAAMLASVKSDGVKVPLAVASRRRGRGFWVVDGCSRLAAARAAGLAEVPCEFLPPASDDAALGDEIFRRNTLRKPFTSSQRVMLWVNIHLGEILESYAPKGGRPKTVSNETVLSVRSIADKIGVSNTDVAAAIELARCVNARLVPDARTGELREAADEGEGERLDAVYADVLHGHTPVRRWKPAFAGMAVGTGGQANANVVRLGIRSFKSLGTVFGGWQSIRPADRQPMVDALAAALAAAPEDVITVIRSVLDERK